MELHESLGFLVNRLAHSMGQELDAQVKRHGVTISQWVIMNLLWHKEGLSQVDIQESLSIEGSTVSGLLQRMQKAGLIRKAPDPQDGRVTRVFLTERGKSLEEALNAEAEQVNRKAMQGLSADEQMFLIRLVKRAMHNFG
jgi:DNA-binding MarR family transcriptional regulator